MFKSLFTKKNFPWPVFLFSLYPVISLVRVNLGQIRAGDTVRPAGVCLLLGILIFIGMMVMFHHPFKAEFLTSVILIAFFSYGMLYESLQNSAGPFHTLARHRILLGILFALLIGMTIWVKQRSDSFLRLIHQGMLMAGIVAVGIPAVQIGSWLVQNNLLSSSSYSPQQVLTESVGKPGNLPDIYYIILDSYTRSDTMKAGVGFDNSEFIKNLRSMGFYVADCAQSNYSQTYLSLTSILNMNYIHGLVDENGEKGPVLYKSWRKSFQESLVTESLKAQGYHLMTYESNYPWLTFNDAEMIPVNLNGMTPFEGLLKDQSILSAIPDRYLTGLGQDAINRRKYQSIQYVLRQTETLPEKTGPKFVFIHLSVPHPPFVFGPDGQYQTVAGDKSEFDDNYSMEDYLLGYKNQSEFISKQMIEVLQALINGSATPPVIIVQGDHGPSHLTENDRMNILNALYIPGLPPETLYPTISPVNSFRVIFNTIFGENLPLQPDLAFYTKNEASTNFIPVANKCEEK